MIFIKKKSVVVDCFATDQAIFDNARPAPAKCFIPDWWRKLPLPDKNQFAPNVNMRFCAGFIDYYANGFVIPLWSDLHVEVGESGSEDYRWQYADRHSSATNHAASQWGDFFSPTDFLHLKLICPWIAKTKKQIDFLWSEPTWNLLNSGVRLLPAVTNFYYQRGMNINLLFPRGITAKLVDLKFNTPLAVLTPITDSKIKFKYHLLSEEERNKIENPQFSFIGNYYKNKNILDSKKAKSRCPFHKG